ncbi:hypothetical protein SDC9_179304 [bioreactor metagenome]|uniref:Uncharacterized protein n=1 Tax=bioreactor metagenome TaxID=1076179 RepID=A0A645H1F1_9ZZZZ
MRLVDDDQVPPDALNVISLFGGELIARDDDDFVVIEGVHKPARLSLFKALALEDEAWQVKLLG